MDRDCDLSRIVDQGSALATRIGMYFFRETMTSVRVVSGGMIMTVVMVLYLSHPVHQLTAGCRRSAVGLMVGLGHYVVCD